MGVVRMSEQLPKEKLNWERYCRRGVIEARPYRPGDENNPHISISVTDRERVQGLEGGMIARNPSNHDDQWYIAPSYFMEHYE